MVKKEGRPLCPSSTSPKYDMKTAYDHFNLGVRILGRKSADSQAGMSALEGEIDQLVYQLYGLSEDEIKIVEGNS
jgi:adenine-specific DNA-methyltransferase